eukprot:gene48846-30666_t
MPPLREVKGLAADGVLQEWPGGGIVAARAIDPCAADHAVVLVYGAAGSGRWHTLRGTPGDPGAPPHWLRVTAQCLAFRGDGAVCDALNGGAPAQVAAHHPADGAPHRPVELRGARRHELRTAGDVSAALTMVERHRRRWAGTATATLGGH